MALLLCRIGAEGVGARSIASIFGQTGEYALIVDTTLKVGDIEKNVSGKVVMLPDPGSLEILFRKLQVL